MPAGEVTQRQEVAVARAVSQQPESPLLAQQAPSPIGATFLTAMHTQPVSSHASGASVRSSGAMATQAGVGPFPPSTMLPPFAAATAPGGWANLQTPAGTAPAVLGPSAGFGPRMNGLGLYGTSLVVPGFGAPYVTAEGVTAASAHGPIPGGHLPPSFTLPGQLLASTAYVLPQGGTWPMYMAMPGGLMMPAGAAHMMGGAYPAYVTGRGEASRRVGRPGTPGYMAAASVSVEELDLSHGRLLASQGTMDV